jgi:hypothetical protein
VEKVHFARKRMKILRCEPTNDIALPIWRNRTNARLNLDDCDIVGYGGGAFMLSRLGGPIDAITLGRNYRLLVGPATCGL